MPRNFKFLFGDRLIQMMLDFLERLHEAYYSRKKVSPLTAANLQIEKLRHLLKICVDMNWLALAQYEFDLKLGQILFGQERRGAESNPGENGEDGLAWFQICFSV